MQKSTQFIAYVAKAGIDKLKFTAILAISFAAPFMLLFFSPLDIYLNNPVPFIAGWRLLLPHLLALFLVGFVVMFITLLLLCHKKIIPGISLFVLGIVAVLFARFAFGMFTYIYLYAIAAIAVIAVFYAVLKKLLKENTSDIILLGVLGVVLSAYVQTLFLNGSMVADVGASPSYSAFTLANILNLLMWAAVALMPIGVWVCVRVAKKSFRFDKAVLFTAVIISGMQIVGLGGAAVSTELPRGIEEGPHKYVSFYNSIEFSEEKNIMVFILDRLDVRFMREAFQLYPHLKDTLYGFTHFENNIAEFFTTLPSVVSMLTQHYYTEGQTFAEYWEEAWAQHNVIDTLRENGFRTNLYLDQWSTIGDLSDIENRTDNIIEAYEGFYVSLNTRSFISIIPRLSLGRVMPYLLKNISLAEITLDFGYHLIAFSIETLDAQPTMAGPHHDYALFDFIYANEFTANIEDGVFTFIHLNGAHGGSNPVSFHSIVLNFEILDHFFSNMRDIGVFDDSTIIIVGDHVYYDLGVPFAVSLLIKPPGASGELVTDTESEMSTEFFAASILQIAGLPHEHMGLSFFDVIAGATVPTRTTYYLTRWYEPFMEHGPAGTMSLLGFYKLDGYAGDANNWVFIPNTD